MRGDAGAEGGDAGLCVVAGEPSGEGVEGGVVRGGNVAKGEVGVGEVVQDLGRGVGGWVEAGGGHGGNVRHVNGIVNGFCLVLSVAHKS